MKTLSSHTIDELLLPEKAVVLDVGSRNYGFAGAILALRPLATIICVEPDPDCPRPVEPSMQLVNKALVGSRRQTAPYCAYSTGEGNYLADKEWFKPNPGTIIEVPCITLRELMDTLDIHWFDCVKLDCEGCEYEILEGWPVPPMAAQISVEFHDFLTPTRHDAAYYQRLWAHLHHYRVRQHCLSTVGPGRATGHWDTLLTL